MSTQDAQPGRSMCQRLKDAVCVNIRVSPPPAYAGLAPISQSCSPGAVIHTFARTRSPATGRSLPITRHSGDGLPTPEAARRLRRRPPLQLQLMCSARVPGQRLGVLWGHANLLSPPSQLGSPLFNRMIKMIQPPRLN